MGSEPPETPLKELQDVQSVATYNAEESAIWRNASSRVESSPQVTSSVTLLPLSSQCEIFSSFGEEECGEPSKAQHLVIDFTPDPVIDNDESQQKCCAFWDYIDTRPDLKHIFVLPGPSSLSSLLPEVQMTTVVPTHAEEHAAAVSVLEQNSDGEHAEFISDAFQMKMPASKCTLGMDSYSEEGSNRKESPQKSGLSQKPNKLSICACRGICSKCKKSKPKSPRVKVHAKELCNILDEWDKKHPKSMEPPGRVMQHLPILQRKLPPLQDPKTCFD